MTEPGDAPDLRASDAEREAAMAVLQDAAGEGRLTLEELTDRLEAADAARTRGELARLTADLPEPAAAAGRLPSTGGAAAAVDVGSVFGDVRRSGRWSLPGTSRWHSVFGDVVLDLREAHVAGRELTVAASTVFGDIDLLVPEGIVVDVRTRSILGDVRQEAAESAPAGAPRVVLTGWTVFGDVKVRSQRLREKLAERWRGGRGVS